METLYRKVAVSDIEMNKWYFRDTEDGYFDMFYCTKLEWKTISGIGIINNEIDNDLEFEKHYFMSDFFELKEIPDTTAQLKADKEELQNWKDSAMEVMNDLNLQEIGKILKLELGTSISKQLFSKVSELVAGKEKLLEALEKVKRLEPIICIGGAVAEQWLNEAQALNEMMAEIESLIQKMKK